MELGKIKPGDLVYSRFGGRAAPFRVLSRIDVWPNGKWEPGLLIQRTDATENEPLRVPASRYFLWKTAEQALAERMMA